jgi:hypothetical protein
MLLYLEVKHLTPNQPDRPPYHSPDVFQPTSLIPEPIVRVRSNKSTTTPQGLKTFVIVCWELGHGRRERRCQFCGMKQDTYCTKDLAACEVKLGSDGAAVSDPGHGLQNKKLAPPLLAVTMTCQVICDKIRRWPTPPVLFHNHPQLYSPSVVGLSIAFIRRFVIPDHRSAPLLSLATCLPIWHHCV